MEYLIRFVQMHETFRRPEVQALATLAGINVEFLVYSEYVRSFIIKTCATILLLVSRVKITSSRILTF